MIIERNELLDTIRVIAYAGNVLAFMAIVLYFFKRWICKFIEDKKIYPLQSAKRVNGKIGLGFYIFGHLSKLAFRLAIKKIHPLSWKKIKNEKILHCYARKTMIADEEIGENIWLYSTRLADTRNTMPVTIVFRETKNLN